MTYPIRRDRFVRCFKYGRQEAKAIAPSQSMKLPWPMNRSRLVSCCIAIKASESCLAPRGPMLWELN